MDNNALLAMLPQLLEAQRDFFASQTVLVNTLIDERNNKKKIVEKQVDKLKIISRIRKLTSSENFLEWRTDLFTALKVAGLVGHILKDIPPPSGKADYEKWEVERAEVDFYIQSSVALAGVWAELKRMGWNSTVRNPKATFDKLTEYFFKH